MSIWYQPKKEDIEISKDGKMLDVFIFSDHNGANYAEIKISDIKEILKEGE